MGYNDFFKLSIIIMSTKLIFSLTHSLILFNNLEIKNIQKISIFVKSQIIKMPDYFFVVVNILSIFFEIIIFITHFRRFQNLSNSKRNTSIYFIKKNNIPFFNLFIRLIESNVLVKYYELNNEK